MNENNRIIAEGYSKNSGSSSEGFTMFAEVQPQVTQAETERSAIIQIRVGVFPASGTLSLDALRENCIQMSVKQAHEFVQSIRSGITQAIEMHAAGCSVSGLLLFGKSEFLVGLNNLNMLRIPLTSFPAVKALSEKQRVGFHFLPDRSGFEWPELGLRLPLSELIQKAVSIEDGTEGPN